jgi:pimeloyl-ACP methyl ester carboxylesterase
VSVGSREIAEGDTSRATVSDAVVDLPTGPVFFRDSGGDGFPVVLLHAASGNSHMWEHQIPALVGAGYRLVAVDYRGVNGKPGPYDWSDQIDALVVHLSIERFHLLGTAAGGGAAFQYALAYPGKVRSLIVANSHGNVTDRDYVEMGKRIRPSPHFDDLPLEFRELGPSYRAARPEGVARWLALSGKKPGAETALRKPRHETIATPYADLFALRPARTVTWAKLEALQTPALLITGDADLYMPPSVLRMFLAHMGSAESTIIPETGHSSYWENPDLFNEAVLAFVGKH